MTVNVARTGRERRRETEEPPTRTHSVGTGEEYHTLPGDVEETAVGGNIDGGAATRTDMGAEAAGGVGKTGGTRVDPLGTPGEHDRRGSKGAERLTAEKI